MIAKSLFEPRINLHAEFPMVMRVRHTDDKLHAHYRFRIHKK